MNNPVNWFEIPVHDLDRATTFYNAIFDVQLDRQQMGPMQMAWFPMTQNAPGSTGTLIQADGYTPSHDGSLVYFSVEDIEATLEKVQENGGKVLSSKSSIGEHGFVASFEDTEGNRVALHART